MPRINIPKSAQAAFIELAGLEDNLFEEFLEALKKVEPQLCQIDIADTVSEHITDLDVATVRRLLGPLFSIYRVMDSKKWTPKQSALNVAETIERESKKEFLTSVLTDRLENLLSIGGLISVISKAVTVMLDQDKNFCGARILSDFRPVFSDSPESIEAAIVMHSLNLSFHQDSKHHDIYIACTDGDLKQLKDVIERAEQKSLAMNSFIQQSGLKLLKAGGTP